MADRRPFPWHFRLFSPDAKHPAWRPKAAVPESDMRVEILDTHPERNSGNHAFSAHQVISVIVGAGASGPCRRARERAALESSPIPDKSQLQNETSSIPRGGRQLNARFLGAFHQLVQGLHDFLGLMLGDDAETQARFVLGHGGVHGGGHDDALFAQAVG